MVVKIQAATSSASHAVDYNEEKVTEGVAEVVFSSKIMNLSDPMATFQLYENASGSGRLGFHASVNPSEEDLQKMSQSDMLEFMKDWMARMGYGDQPYIIYAHNDIGRPHYHIISVRCDYDGKMISEWQERKRSREHLKQMEEKYSFKLGRAKKNAEDMSMATKARVHGQQDIRTVERFDPKAGKVAAQIERLVNNAMRYHFTSEQQFIFLMQEMGIKVSIEERKGKTVMRFHGIDPKTGNVCTARINGSRLIIPSPAEINAYAQQCRKEPHRKEIDRVSGIVGFCLKNSRTAVHFERMLARKNIAVKYSFSSDKRLMGATFIGHQTRSVFKCSELRRNKIQLHELERVINEVWPPFNADGKTAQVESHNGIDREIDKFTDKLEEFTAAALNLNNGQRGQDEKRNREAQRRKRTIYG